MSNMNKRFKFIHFLFTLIFRKFYLFIPSLLFLIIGLWSKTLLIFGFILLFIDIFLSYIDCVNLENTLNNLDDEELKNAFASDDWQNEIEKIVQKKCEEYQKEMELKEQNYSNIYINIKEQLDEKMTFHDIVKLFKGYCDYFKSNEDYFKVELKDDIFVDQEIYSLFLSYRFYTIDNVKELVLEFLFDKNDFFEIDYFEFENNDTNEFYNRFFKEKFVKQILEENVFFIKINLYENIVE